MQLEVRSVTVKHGSLFSMGWGVDMDGNFCQFITHTGTAIRLDEELQKLGQVDIMLQPWQLIKHGKGNAEKPKVTRA